MKFTQITGAETVNLYALAYTTDENDTGPEFAKILITNEFLKELTRLSQICIDNNLESVSIYEDPEFWGPEKIVEDLRLQGSEMFVLKNGFWFKSYPKYGFAVETTIIDFEKLNEILVNRDSNIVYYDITKEKIDEILQTA